MRLIQSSSIFTPSLLSRSTVSFLIGHVTFRLLRGIDHYQVEVLLTLGAVFGGYALASRLEVSGPLAMVVTGLLVGNQGRALAMSDTTRHHLDLFWELIDEILNAVLFVLVGMEVVLIHFTKGIALASAGAIAVTLAARWLTVGLPVGALRKTFKLPKGAGTVLTWGGLRGAISVALCLSLPHGATRDSLLTMTYCVVVFSIMCQGLTIGRVVRLVTKDARPGFERVTKLFRRMASPSSSEDEKPDPSEHEQTHTD